MWQVLTILEGFGLGMSRLFFALGGGVSPDFSHVLFLLLCAGVVQMTIGLLWAILRTRTLCSLRISGVGHTTGPVALGFFGLIANACAFAAFQGTSGRADMTAVTFLSSVPGIVLAAVFAQIPFLRLKEKLGMRQVAGLLVAIYGAYLTIPLSISVLYKNGIPLWVWFSLGTVTFATSNEAISKWMANWEEEKAPGGKLAPWTLQFWGGMTMVVVAGAVFLVCADPHTHTTINTGTLWSYGVGAGLCNIFWWTCRLFAYQGAIVGTQRKFDKAPVYLRRFPAIGMALLTALVVGAFRFHDPFTLEKIAGIALFVPAFFLAQNGSEKWLKKTWSHIAGRRGVTPAFEISTPMSLPKAS